MFKNKNRPSSLANNLRDNGIPAMGTLNKNGNKPINNPIGYYNPDKTKYIRLWENYDLQQCVGRYVWENLPNGLKSWLVERMLYMRGSLIGFVHKDNNFYLTPYVGREVNVYGLPITVTPITYNGKATGGDSSFFGVELNLPINVGGDLINGEAFILYDNIPINPNAPSVSRFSLNSLLIKEIADTFARININIVVSNKKILLECKDPNQSDIIRKELEIAFGSDSPFAIITSPLENSTIQTTSDFQCDDLFNTIHQYNNIRCFMSGIASSNFGNEKKERLVSGELQGNTEQVNLILDMGLELRQTFCDEVNKAFGLNISVRKRNDGYIEETDGNNQTQEEKEGDL